MASGPGSRVEKQPPVLPVKKLRSHLSRGSSVDADCDALSPVKLQCQSDTFNDVFLEPTDCHAAQCPIHQRYDPSRHQVRYFSDGTPPPVPKKRLARTFSLPGASAPPPSPLSPLSPLQKRPLNIDNPIYMLAPIPDTYFQEEAEEFSSSPVPSLSLSQLSFDTPDEHLPYLFTNFEDQRVVFQGIQHRHLLFLRSVAQSVDAGILLQDISPCLPQDFLLCEGSEPRHVGDTVYYSLHSPMLPGRRFGLRVHKLTDERSPAYTKHQPSHVNVQQVVAHFHPSNAGRSDLSTAHALPPGCTDASASRGGSTEQTAVHNLPFVQSFLLEGHSLSVERDLPHFTLEDFVQSSSSLEKTSHFDYDRQMCVLLLQILMASQHLYNISASAAKLSPREIFLVWPCRGEKEGRDMLESSASGMKTSRLKEEGGWQKTEDNGGKVQMLWRAHGPPRVVLIPMLPVPQDSHRIYIKFRIGALIQYCLQSQESQTSQGSGPTLPQSSYRKGLLYLASVLQGDDSGPQIEDMVTMLQVLLWGPRVSGLDCKYLVTTSLHNWLTIKRALFVMKLAERGLIQDQSTLDWEDSLCLKYLSFTDSEAIATVCRQLQFSLKMI